MRLLIAIPCGDMVRYEFAESLSKLELQLFEDGIDFDVKWQAGSLIYDARDMLAITAIEEGFTHILWLDSDMVFSRDLFNILYAEMKTGKPFVSGMYRSRRSPYAFALFSKVNTGQRVLTPPSEPFEIEACGFGCVLIETEAVKEVRSRYGTCFLPDLTAGEDVAFCNRYRKLGHKIYAVPDARASHISYVQLRCDDPQNLIDYKEKR